MEDTIEINGSVYRREQTDGMRYVIVRCRDAGVHAGYLESYSGREAQLRQARRLWRWCTGPSGTLATLSKLANHGLYQDDRNRITEPVSHVILTETCEILDTTTAARESIQGYPNAR